MKKLILYALLLINAGLLTAVLFTKSCGDVVKPDQPITTHSIVVEKISALGKMELVQYNFQDIVTHEVLKDWWPFDPKVVLLVEGEAIGCVDFGKMDSTMVTRTRDTLFLRLPQPEICVAKIDHSKSRVYDTRYTAFEKAELVDEAYQKAEEAIFEAALRAEIIQKTEDQARQTLAPMLGQFTDREVVISFPARAKQELIWE
ncbi:MAG: DUF4230 domain-containing protein [Bacteroidia bacterium]